MKLRVSLPLTIIVLLLLAIMIRLGFWQLGRAEEKQVRLDAYAAGVELDHVTLDRLPERYGRVSIEGRFDDSRHVIMDGFSVDKRAGYQVLTPFLVGDTVLMVNRGWRVWHGDRGAIEGLEVDRKLRTLTGRAEPFWRPGMVLGEGNAGESASWPRIVVYPQHDEIQTWMQQAVAPWQLLLEPDEANGFYRDWQPTGLPPERHKGYAVQWFALALTLFVLYCVITVKQSRSVGNEE
ncbi:MAG: SURF1 family protein [Pseudomonadota bacterium]